MLDYKPLFKLLIDRGMGKLALCELAGISPCTLAKMGKGLSVTLDIVAKVCAALDCDIQDVVQFRRGAEQKEK